MDQNVRSSHPSIRQSKHQPRRKKRKGRGCFQRSQIRHFPKLVLRYQCLQMWVWHEKRWTEAMAFIDRSPVARTAMFFNGFVYNVVQCPAQNSLTHTDIKYNASSASSGSYERRPLCKFVIDEEAIRSCDNFWSCHAYANKQSRTKICVRQMGPAAM